MIASADTIVNVKLAVALAEPPESVARIVSGALTAVTVGVPLSTPPVLSVKPAGSDPAVNAQVKGPPAPPVAVKVCE